MAKRLRLRSTRIRSLRHHRATELIAAGVDLRTAAGRLGHGNGGTTTLKTYAAWVDAADRKAAETMPRSCRRPSQPRSHDRAVTALAAEGMIEVTRGRKATVALP